MRNLPADRSLWRESYTGPVYPKLEGEYKVDVVVIGAGITGLTAAYLLKQAGKTVAVIDKDTVGGGTTGRTTGKVTAQHGLIYATLQQRFGAKVASIYATAMLRALEKVREIELAEHIDCDLETQDNYVFTTDTKQIKKFKKEAAAASDLGLPASFETTSPLPFEIQAAVKFSGQAKMNAQAYVLGLARAVDGNGSYVFEHSGARSIHSGQPCTVGTADGSIIASDIIVATNVPTLPLAARITYCLMEYPVESHLVAGRLPQQLTGMYISPDKDNYSILPVSMGKEHLLLIGGEGHLSPLRGSRKHRWQRLASYGEERFGVTEITHAWSDRDYMAYDDIPVIGKLYPWSSHAYVGTAFKKWGLTSGTVAGMILSDLVLGNENPWAKTFAPHRFSATASIPRVALQHLLGKG